MTKLNSSIDPDHVKSGFVTKQGAGNYDGLDIATFVQETIA